MFLMFHCLIKILGYDYNNKYDNKQYYIILNVSFTIFYTNHKYLVVLMNNSLLFSILLFPKSL